MAPKAPEPAAAAPTDGSGLPAFSDEALAAEVFALDAPFEDATGTELPQLLAGER